MSLNFDISLNPRNVGNVRKQEMILKDKNLKQKVQLTSQMIRIHTRPVSCLRVHSDKDLFCIFRISKIPEMAK